MCFVSPEVFKITHRLAQKLEQVDDDEEARKRGFPKGGSFKLLKRDIILLTEEQSHALRQQSVRASEVLYCQTEGH